MKAAKLPLVSTIGSESANIDFGGVCFSSMGGGLGVGNVGLGKPLKIQFSCT